MVRLRDPRTGRDLLTYEEGENGSPTKRPERGSTAETAEARQQQAEAHRSAEARVEREIAARQAAEARTAELEARLRDLEGAATASQEPGT